MKRFFQKLFERRIVIIAVAVIVLYIVFAVASPLFATHDPNAIDLMNKLKPMSSEHLLGTDQYGRDIYSRIVYGTRTALLIGVCSVLVACVVGSMIGMVAGYFGGIVDSVLMRIIEAQMAIPSIMLALALVAVLGSSIPLLTIILGISAVPSYARMMRSSVLTVRNLDYVEASILGGNSHFVTMMRHVFPNCLSPLIVIISQTIGTTILSEASLSFLGVGIAPPTASWGQMVSDGYAYLNLNPVFAIAPGLAIIILVLAFNIIGDGLRDALDPRMRGV